MTPSPTTKNKRKPESSTATSTKNDDERANKEDDGPQTKKLKAGTENGAKGIAIGDANIEEQWNTPPAIEPADNLELEDPFKEDEETKLQSPSEIKDKIKQFQAKYPKYRILKPGNLEIDILKDRRWNTKMINTYKNDLVYPYVQYLRWGGLRMEFIDKYHILSNLLQYYTYMKEQTKCMVLGCRNKSKKFYSHIMFYNKRVVCSTCVQKDNRYNYIPNKQTNALALILDKMLKSYENNYCAFLDNNCQRLGLVPFWPRHEIFCKHQTTHCPLPICSTSTTPRKDYYYYELEDHIKAAHGHAVLPENETMSLNLDFIVVLKRKTVFVLARRLLNKESKTFGCAVFMIVPHVETTDVDFKLSIGNKEVEGVCVGTTGQYLTYSYKIFEESLKHPVAHDTIDSLQEFLDEPIKLRLPSSCFM